MKTINDWYPETKDLLDELVNAGCTLLRGDNGENTFKFEGDIDDFIENLTACDESHLYVMTPNSEFERWVYLVYGNEPGELASDYIVDKTIDAVTGAHYDKWSKMKQPTKTE